MYCENFYKRNKHISWKEKKEEKRVFDSRRKVISVSLAVAMMVTSIFGLTEQSNAAGNGNAQTIQKVDVATNQVDATENQVVLHAKAPDSNPLHVWAWTSAGPITEAKEWPGDLMTADSSMGDGWYTYTVNDASAEFIVHNDTGDLKSPDTKKEAGEYWYVNGTFTDYNPEGPTPIPPTPSPKPANGLADIKSISPAEGSTFKVDEPATISVEASGSSDIKFYKYEVKMNGVYVSEHYYSTKDEYTFTPTEKGDYTVTVYAQAHNEENTTDSQTLTYKVGDKGNIEPTDTPKPGKTPDPDKTPDPEETLKPTDTPGPGKTSDPTDTPDPNNTPKPTNTPDPTKTKGPAKTNEPTKRPIETKRPTSQPTAKPTSVPTNKPTAKPTYKELSLYKVSTNKKSSQVVGSKIKIKAFAKGGQGSYRYTFIAKDITNNKKYILARSSKQSYIYWKPTKPGKYSLQVSLYDRAGSGDMDYKSVSYTIKAKPVNIKSLKGYRKSNRRVQFKAVTTGGSKKVYRFYAMRNGKRVYNRGYSSKSNVLWRFAKKGTYRIYVKVKDKSTGLTKTKSISFRVK